MVRPEPEWQVPLSEGSLRQLQPAASRFYDSLPATARASFRPGICIQRSITTMRRNAASKLLTETLHIVA